MTLAAALGQFGDRLHLHDVQRERDVDVYYNVFKPVAKAGIEESQVLTSAQP